MTDPIHETGRVSITAGMAKAMVHYGAARQCPECQFGIPKYVGRYPAKCPRCEGAMCGTQSESLEEESAMPVVCVSNTHRIQQVIESGQQSFEPYLGDSACSRMVTVPYEKLPEGFANWLEGPVNGLYFRIESATDPLLVCEMDDTRKRMRIFATENPARYLAYDPRAGIVDEDHDATFEQPETVRMVDVGTAGLHESIAAGAASGLQLYLSEEDASRAAESVGLTLTPSQRTIAGDKMWLLVHEHTGYALGKGEVRRLLNEVFGSGPGAPTYSAATYGSERVRARHRAVDKTHDRVAGAFVERRSSRRRPRKPGEGPTQIRGGTRIHVGANKDRKPNKDVQQSLQNKMNQKRGLRARITGAKKWHRSREGKKMHQDLGRHNAIDAAQHDAALRGKIMDVKDRILRYSAGQQRSMGLPHLGEDIGTLRPNSAGGTDQMTARGPQNLDNPTPDDHLEALLRRLIVTQNTDVLQDVEFDEDTGSLYLFFDPVLMPDEVEEILSAVRQERGDIELVASPDMSLPGEAVESDWWVLFLAGPGEAALADPMIYARDPEQYGTKIQALVMAPLDTPEALAQGIDVAGMLKAAGS